MDRPSFWIAWGIIALVLTFIIGSIIDSYDIAFYISAGIIVLIWIIWFCVDKVKEQSDIDQNDEQNSQKDSHLSLKEPEMKIDEQRKETHIETAIGKGAFSNRLDLTVIEIPDSITAIGDNAFMGCQNLSTVVIPSSVKSIGNFAFANCKKLERVVLAEGIISIGNSAFA